MREQRKHMIWTYVLLVIFAVVALLPLYYLVITSMKGLEEASTRATFWPESFHLFQNISFVLKYPDYQVGRFFINTMIVFILKASGTALSCSLAAYGFTRFRFPGKNIIFIVLLSAVMIPSELLGVPIFEFMVNAGLREAFWFPLWIGAWFATDIFVIFLFRQFFKGIPSELFDAAKMDGCSELQAFFKIMVPLSKPVFVTVLLLYFVGTYNDLYGPAVYIISQENFLMAQSINMFETLYKTGSSSYIVPWNYVSVATMIGMIPVFFIFSAAQKQFVESVAGVGLKG
ncbi:MAG: carbohydrate ABC transporter permease [Acholeplasmataceae bacterium]|nr:carbohydrate ABC transporter permease [Acholeplasmataceae bacterium]